MNKFKTLRVKLFLILMTAWSSVVFAQPVITSFSPTTGAIGTTVTITGTGFNTAAAQNIVYFGGAKAVITSATATLLTVTVPVGSTYEPISATSALSGLTAFSSNPFDVTFNSVGGIDANSFDPRVNFTVGIQPYGIVSADLDLDGKPDLAIPNTNAANTVSVLRNNAAIGLINSSTLNSNITFSSGNNTSRVQVADIDGDGRKDIIETNYGDNTFSVLMNTANPGSITSSSFAARVSFTTGSNPFGIAVNDIDMDGRPDVIVVNCQSNNISVFRNTSTLGNISFAPKVDFGISGQSFYVMLTDIDGDRKPEIIAVVTSTGGVTIFRNTSTPGIINASTFASPLLITTGLTPRDFDIADMDGDGKVDILVPNQDNANFSVYRNLSTVGSISFSARVNFSTVTNPSGAKIGDIDGDGKPDLVIIGSNTAQVFKNTSTSGTFSFGTGISFALGNSPMNTVIVDMDGDGKPEICVFNFNDGTISILHNKILTPPTITSFSPTSGSIGTLVSISGTSLTNPTAFTIGGKAAIVISNDGSTLVGMVMPGATTGNISITTAGGLVNSASNFTVTPSLLPVSQQGSKLVGTGNIGNTQQGYSVSLSADGNTAIIGGDNDNGSIGAAWIYTRTGSSWTQQGSKLVGTGYIGNSYQGSSVSISADGNTAIVGGYGDTGNTGAAWIYTRSGSTWTQQGSKLVGTGYTGASGQGYSISLSADGNTALVGGYYDNTGIGAAWVYTRSGSTWTQQGAKLVGIGNTGTPYQGYSVSLCADGNTAIIGGYYDNGGLGAAWVYTRSGSTWTQQGAKLVGTGNVGQSFQGASVSLNADGNTAIVGGSQDNSGIGAAWIYTRTGSTWTKQGAKLVGTGNTGTSYQGWSVSLSADGNTALVGGRNDNSNIGAAWIYTRSGSTWTQQGSKLVGTGYTGTPYQGLSVSLSADGNTALVGGPNDNGIGAAWVFTPPPPPTVASFSPASGSVGTLVTISGTSLTNPSAFTIGGKAAIVISNDGSTLVGMVMPGATTGNISITTAGGLVNSASNFTVTPSLLPVSQQGSKLVGTGNIGTSQQGESISLSADGNTAIVGGYTDNSGIGAAWIYTRSGSTWTQQGSKLVGTGYTGTPSQGISVSLSADGNTAIVGGFGDNGAIGAAWIYTRSGSTWTQQGSKLVGTGNVGQSWQGSSVSLSADGNTALVGGQDDNGGIGAAWIYTRSGSTWTQQGSKLVGTDYVGVSDQGWSVSLSADGNTALVGGYGDNASIGAAWIYTRIGSTWTQQGSKLVGTGYVGTSEQGVSVSLSADGNTAIVGGDGDNDYTIGAAWIYTRSGSTWTQQGSKLVGTGYTGTPYQGYSVSLSADGNTALVGGFYDNTGIGAAWIYTRSGSTWTQQGSKLVGTDNTGTSLQGISVSLSADGNTALVGGYGDNGNIGAAWAFTPPPPPIVASFTPASGSVGTLVTITGTDLDNPLAFSIGGKPAIIISKTSTTLVGMVMPDAVTGTISVSNGGGSITSAGSFTVTPSLLPVTQQGSKLVGTGNIGNSQQGYSVSLSADGNTAIVGGSLDNSNVGAAWIYTRIGTTWTQQGSKLVGTGYVGQSYQGSSVSLSADGNTALVGGYTDNSDIGAAWIYTRSGGTWTQQGAKLVGTDYTGAPWQGFSVSLSADGNTALVGGWGDNTGIGASWIYTRSGSTWTQQGSKLVGTGAVNSPYEANQGQSVSLSADGNTAIEGGPGDNSNTGAAWIFTRSGSIWTQQGSKLVGTGNVGQSWQGYSVSISADGNTAMVGGVEDNSNLGAAWIYTRSGSTWTQQGTKLVGTGSAGNANQGWSVSLSADGNTAFVGGANDNGGIGAAWIYTRSGSTWTQQGSKLVGTGYIGSYIYQGYSVSLSADGNTALVGGQGDNGFIGAAWVFTPLLPPLAIDATGILTDGFTANWNASTGATGYQLDVDDNNDFSSPIINNLDVTGFTTKAVTGLTPLTTYYYRVRAYNANSTSGNSNVITVITVSVITDIKDLQKENVIIVYPNPANGIITLSGLSFIANDQSVSLIISDIFGKTMLSKKLGKNTESETIDISSLGNGVYFIILQTDLERIVKRFVKQ